MAQATAELAPVAEAAALPAEEPAAPGLPDYMTDPNAVLKDVDAEWRYGRPPDYSKTRQAFAESMPHRPTNIQTRDTDNI